MDAQFGIPYRVDKEDVGDFQLELGFVLKSHELSSHPGGKLNFTSLQSSRVIKSLLTTETEEIDAEGSSIKNGHDKAEKIKTHQHGNRAMHGDDADEPD